MPILPHRGTAIAHFSGRSFGCDPSDDDLVVGKGREEWVRATVEPTEDTVSRNENRSA